MAQTPNQRPPATGSPHVGNSENMSRGNLGFAGLIIGLVLILILIAVFADRSGGSAPPVASSDGAMADGMRGNDTASADREGALFELDPDQAFVKLQSPAGTPNLIIYFQAEPADLTVNFAEAAEPIQNYAEQNPDAQFEVIGFADTRTENDTPEPLAAARAATVAEALNNAGIDPSRLVVRGAADGAAPLRSGDNTGRAEVRTLTP